MSKVIKHVFLAGVFALLGALPFIANAGETLQRVNDFQVLRVGMSGNQPPMTMTTREGGLMGFDVDLAQALAMAMNVKLEISTIPFGELMTALEENKIDMVLSNMSITPARTEMVSFVGPYMMSGMSILTKNSTLGKISSAEEFNRADLKLLALKRPSGSLHGAPRAPTVWVARYACPIWRRRHTPRPCLPVSLYGAVTQRWPACVTMSRRWRTPGSSIRRRAFTAVWKK
jgi:hypothetical protein